MRLHEFFLAADQRAETFSQETSVKGLLERFVDARAIKAERLAVIGQQGDQDDVGEVIVFAQVLADLQRFHFADREVHDHAVGMETLCLDTAPGAMAIYSGCLIREAQWKAGVSKLAGTRVVQSHGQLDSILPLAAGLWLRDLLLAEGCQVEFLQFQGPHTISWEAIESTARLLDELAAGEGEEADG